MINEKNSLQKPFFVYALIIFLQFSGLPTTALADSETSIDSNTTTSEIDTASSSRAGGSNTSKVKKPSFELHEGIHYKKIDPKIKNVGPIEKVEIIEIFTYRCKHCNSFEPSLIYWKRTLPKYIHLDYMHTSWGKKDELLSKAFFTARTLNITNELRQPLFDFHHKKGKQFRNSEDVRDFFVANGITRNAFDSHFDSSEVRDMVADSKEKLRRYKPKSAPSFVVAGQYYIDNQLALHKSRLFRILEAIAERVHRGDM